MATKGEVKVGVSEALKPYEDPTPLANGKMALNVNISAIVADDVNISQIGGATITLGQALAAASIPVVLTAAQLSTLTPPSTVAISQGTPGTTNFVQNKAMPDATATFAVTPYASAALEASAVVKASAGVLYGGIVSANASGLYLQVFNSPTVPVDGTVPTIPGIPLTANVPFSFDMGAFGNYFSAGISVCISTTQFTKTVGGSNAVFYIQKA